MENGNMFLLRQKNGDGTEAILVTASIAGSSVKHKGKKENNGNIWRRKIYLLQRRRKRSKIF